MIWVYRVLFLPGLLLGLPYYAYRMWRRGGYRKGFENRLGLMRKVPPKRKGVKRIWLQAVSVGELLAVQPLLKRLREDPAVEVVMTTTTSTGFLLLEEKLAAGTVWHGVFPLDFWFCSRSAWKALQPDMSILMEGELWPEHIHQGARRGVPVLLLNARLSDRSYARHLPVRSVTRHWFRTLEAILAGSETDHERFRSLGWLPPDKIQLTGNLKLDIDMEPAASPEEQLRLRGEFGFAEGALVLLGSSTWPGEETALIETCMALQGDHPQLRLLLVPRHAERRGEIEAQLRRFPLRAHFRSRRAQAPAGTEVYVADTTGELRRLTGCADLVFIGKSLPPNSGGQTPVEAAALGKPLLFGPDMSNFRDISRRLVREGAARRLAGAEQLLPCIRSLLACPDERAAMGARGAACIAASHGATARTCGHIRARLS